MEVKCCQPYSEWRLQFYIELIDRIGEFNTAFYIKCTLTVKQTGINHFTVRN